MLVNMNGEPKDFEYMTHFVKSLRDPLIAINSEWNYEATEVTFQPEPNKDERLETSVILHKSKDDIPWLQGARIYNKYDDSGVLGKTPAYAVTVACDKAVGEIGLKIEGDPLPERGMPDHANLVGWDIARLSEQLGELASCSDVCVNPTRQLEADNRLSARKAEDMRRCAKQVGDL